MTQDTSWTDIRGVPEYPGLVAQVFFATDSGTLDTQDTTVLGRLAQEYRIPLLGHRIELTCVGNADWRGGTGYNLALAQRRAEAVQRFMLERLGSSDLFSCQRALSHGERNAAQDSPSEARMAEDRRVDVFSSFIPERRVVLPPLRVTGAPPAQRCVYRRYSSTTMISGSAQEVMSGRAGNVGFDNLLRSLVTWVSRLGAAPPLGNEVATDRRYAERAATFRVNSIRIEREELYSPPRLTGPSMLATTSQVHYEWGESAETIQVVMNRSYRDGLSRQTTRTSSTSQVQRNSVSGNSFFFPPDRPR